MLLLLGSPRLGDVGANRPCVPPRRLEQGGGADLSRQRRVLQAKQATSLCQDSLSKHRHEQTGVMLVLMLVQDSLHAAKLRHNQLFGQVSPIRHTLRTWLVSS